MTDHNLDTTYPKGPVAGQYLVGDPRVDACEAALDDLHRRLDRMDADPPKKATPVGNLGEGGQFNLHPRRGNPSQWKSLETAERKDAGDVKIIYNKLLGGWYVVRGPHQTPLSGRFPSKEAAQEWLDRNKSRSDAARNDTSEPDLRWNYMKAQEELNKLESELRGRVIGAPSREEKKRLEMLRDVRDKARNAWDDIVRKDAQARTDPPVSEAQRRFMRWAEEHPGEAGVSRAVSQEFNEADPGGKLPERKDRNTESDIQKRIENLKRWLVQERDEGKKRKIERELQAAERSLPLFARADVGDLGPEDDGFYAGEHRGDHAVFGDKSGKPYCYHDSRGDAAACARDRTTGRHH